MIVRWLQRTPFALLGAMLLPPLLGGCDDQGKAFERLRLDLEFERWVETGIRDYSYRVDLSCFCGLVGPVRIQVLDGVAVSATVIATGEPVPIDDWNTPTVEGLFAIIEEGLNEDWHGLTVEYDATLGYPRRIVADRREMVADDEFTYVADDLRQAIILGLADFRYHHRGVGGSVSRRSGGSEVFEGE